MTNTNSFERREDTPPETTMSDKLSQDSDRLLSIYGQKGEFSKDDLAKALADIKKADDLRPLDETAELKLILKDFDVIDGNLDRKRDSKIDREELKKFSKDAASEEERDRAGRIISVDENGNLLETYPSIKEITFANGNEIDGGAIGKVHKISETERSSTTLYGEKGTTVREGNSKSTDYFRTGMGPSDPDVGIVASVTKSADSKTTTTGENGIRKISGPDGTLLLIERPATRADLPRLELSNDSPPLPRLETDQSIWR